LGLVSDVLIDNIYVVCTLVHGGTSTTLEYFDN